jgi:hypothetical protein
MTAVLFLMMFSGLLPFGRAWWANRHTSLVQAIHWALMAWIAWMAALLIGAGMATADRVDPARYLALCLTGCAGIAVLGARRPYVGAWNFVVLGLLAVLLLPLLEGLLIRGQPPGALHFVFLGAILSVGILNYLPTRLLPAVLLLAAGEAGQMLLLIGADLEPSRRQAIRLVSQVCLIFVPWMAQWSWRRQRAGANDFDRLWLHFRNRFGLVWAQRVREQFNRSAQNAGWPVYLTWRGLRRAGDEPILPPAAAEMLETLTAALKRFEDV